jgi:kynureninase
MTPPPVRLSARELDAADPLRPFRSHFYLLDGHIYLDGNSLGLLSRPAEQAVLRTLAQWKTQAIEGWTEGDHPWYTLAEELAARTAPLIGAASDEVIVTNSTSVNLHQMVATLFRPDGKRNAILTDAGAFPSDLYALKSQLRLHGLDPAASFRLVAPRSDRLLEENDIVAAMTPDVRLALLPAVIYTTGQLIDMERLCSEARERDILIGFDCSHSIGAVPHQLRTWGADFAVWCGYKYLNGGPGSAAGLFLNRRHFGADPGLAGWFGSDKKRQFDLGPDLHPAEGAGSMQIGTPNILSMAPLAGSLSLFEEAGMERIRRKSVAQARFLMELADTRLAPYGFIVVTPREDHRRGGHVALAHPEAMRICHALRRAGVTPDFRPPDIVRLAPAPLYTSFAECEEAVTRLVDIMRDRSYEDLPMERGNVT